MMPEFIPAELVDYVKTSPLLVRSVILLSILFIFSSIFLALVVTINRLSKIVKIRKENLFSEYCVDFITEWAYNLYIGESIPVIMSKHLRSRVKRDFFTKELLLLHSGLSGDSALRLEVLFKMAGLEKYSIKKAKSLRWDIKVKGFSEILQMKIEDGEEIIKKHLRSKNKYLISHSQIAWIYLHPGNPEIFLDLPNVTLSDWWQVNAIDVFKATRVIPQFGNWIEHSNPNVIKFSVRMCGLFKQYESLDKIIFCLKSNDYGIKKEAVKALKMLALPEALQKLTEIYKEESNEIKREIIKAMISISDSSSLHFYESQLLCEEDTFLRILIAKAIIKQGDRGEKALDQIASSADSDLLSIIAHAKDIRI